MPISHKYKLIFIHIPKCAGTSICHALEIDPGEIGLISYEPPILQHLLPKQLKNHYISEPIWNEYKKFTILRNPYDRVISDYFWFKNIPDTSFKGSFDDFLSLREDVVLNNRYSENKYFDHFYPMYFYFDDVVYDYVIRYENMNEEFNKLSEANGFGFNLQHVNDSLKEILIPNKRQLNRIFELYYEDFTRFNYQKHFDVKLSLLLNKNTENVDVNIKNVFELILEYNKSFELNLSDLIQEIKIEQANNKEVIHGFNGILESKFSNLIQEIKNDQILNNESFKEFRTSIEFQFSGLKHEMKSEQSLIKECLNDIQKSFESNVSDIINHIKTDKELRISKLEEQIITTVKLLNESECKNRILDEKIVYFESREKSQNTALSKLEEELGSLRNQIANLSMSMDNDKSRNVELQNAVFWYQQTYEKRSLLGIIKDRFFKK